MYGFIDGIITIIIDAPNWVERTKKRSLIDHQHHIYYITVLRTTETGLPLSLHNL